jgi:hypothetical protein
MYFHLTTRLKKSSPGFRSLNAYVSDCEQIGHSSWLLHGDLLHSLDVAGSIVESIDNLNVLDIWDSVTGVAEIFHVVSEALIMKDQRMRSEGMNGSQSKNFEET